MKKSITLFAAVVFTSAFSILTSYIALGQNVGINTTGATPNTSAMLDVDAAPGNNKGLLIPRIALISVTDAVTIATPATSLLVYHTGSVGLPQAGYYYNSGTSIAPVWTNVGNPHHDFMPVNLVIENDAANPNFQVDITTSSMAAEGVLLTNVNVSADITAAGAGGLDAGAEAANTWYYIFVITNNSGTSVNALLSLSSTAPTLPAGYTKKRRVGAVRNDASSNFLQFIQEGNKCLYAGNQAVLIYGAATTFTAISAASFVPPTSRRAVVRFSIVVVHNAANVSFTAYLRSTGNASSGGELIIDDGVQVANIVSASTTFYSDCGVNASGQMDYRITTAPSGGGGAVVYMAGYYDRL